MVPGGGKPGRPYFTPRLMQQIQALFDEYPELGELDLTDFAQEAAKFYIDYLRRQHLRKQIVELAREGKFNAETARRLFPD